MSLWKSVSKSWVLVWGITFLLGGIIYIGYQSTTVESSQEKALKTIRDKAQEVSFQVPVPIEEEPKDAEDAEVAGDQGPILSYQTQSSGQKVLDASQNNLKEEVSGKRSLTIKDFPSPVQGKILRNIGNYYSEASGNYLFHAGIDYAEPEGTVIRATHRGKVISIELDPLLGQKVTLDCGEGWIVTYAGLDNLRVQIGNIVEKQESIGQVGLFPGAEGQYGQSQLHYEVWNGDKVQSSESEI